MKGSTSRTAFDVGCILLVLFLSSAAVAGQECALRLVPGASLQDAVDSVQSGAVICLSPGEYAGPLTITKSLSIRGAGGSRDEVKIIGKNREPIAVLVRAAGRIAVSFENLTIEANTTTGLFVDGVISLTLEGVHVTRAERVHGAGLLAIGSVDLAAADCLFSDCGDPSNPRRDSGINGVGLAGDSSARFERCTFRGNWKGACVVNNSQAEFLDCLFADNVAIGLQTIGVVRVRAERCAFLGNGTGFSAYSGPGSILLRDSTFSSNDQGIAADMWSWLKSGDPREAPTVVISGCRLLTNGTGILALGWSEMTVSNSEISASLGVGVLAQESAKLEVTECRIIDGGGDGFYLEGKPTVEIHATEILRNAGYGIRAAGKECTPWVARLLRFAGEISGGGNVVPGRFVTDGNKEGSTCPGSLEFLHDS